jgi:predicted nucleotidyltransferase
MIQMVQLIELGNRTLMKVLAFFIRNPSIKISYTNLRKRIKLAKATLAKNLNFLLKGGLIIEERIGLNKIYRLDKESVLVKHLKILDNLLILGEINHLCSKHNIDIYLYGSAARGEDNEESDIDLLIMGKISKDHIYEDLKKFAGRKIKIAVFTKLEWAEMSKNDPAFYERVEKDKIRLC